MEKVVSVVITARNNGKYLGECIESILSQTVKPYEVIYSDDFSTDNSVEIARQFGIKVLTHKNHVGVVAARNNGATAALGSVLVHMDGDDMMTPDFIERHLEVFDESTPFVYCAAQAFGLFETYWDVKAWPVLNLWNMNFVNTSAMMWKHKFVEAGMWQETVEKTMWDWHLAIRMARLGTPRKSSAVLMYRQHQESWSVSAEKSEGMLSKLSVSIRRSLVRTTVGVVYSGRIDGFLPKFMGSIISDTSILANKPQLVFINNSNIQTSKIKSHLNKYSDSFCEIIVISGRSLGKYDTEMQRRDMVCTLLADAYSRILEVSTGDLIHLREDDIITPEGGFKKMFNFITDGVQMKSAVAALYYNRHKNYKRWIGGYYNHENSRSTNDLSSIPSKDPFIIDYTGTGCIMFWKNICPNQFKSHVDGIQAHDWAWCLDIKKNGGQVWMLPDVVCYHHHTIDSYVRPDVNLEINPSNNHTVVSSAYSQIRDGVTVVVKKAMNSIS